MFVESLSQRSDQCFRPRGVIIDDSSHHLYKTIEGFANDYKLPFEYQQISQSDSKAQPIEITSAADFVVVDHRLEGKFSGYEDGLEIVKELRILDRKIPVFYCSAFERDFRRENANFRERALFIETDPYCSFYSKHDLVEDSRLKEFVGEIFTQSLRYATERFWAGFPSEFRSLAHAQISRTERQSFRIVSKAGRGFVVLRPLGGKGNQQDEIIPSRFLKRAGIRNFSGCVDHQIIEFDNGVVMSGFSHKRLSRADLNPEIIKMFEGEGDD